jgi:phosphatidylserine/phosphatidylglycerophosphate/cardiolipin synthase-like enzyme
MITLLSSPFDAHFDWLLQDLGDSCLICSPYVTLDPMARLVLAASERGIQHSLPVKLIADISADTLLNGSTDIDAVLMLSQEPPRSEVVHLSRLHAKVYVAGQSRAIVSSANFTHGGFSTNLEYGVSV